MNLKNSIPPQRMFGGATRVVESKKFCVLSKQQQVPRLHVRGVTPLASCVFLFSFACFGSFASNRLGGASSTDLYVQPWYLSFQATSAAVGGSQRASSWKSKPGHRLTCYEYRVSPPWLGRSPVQHSRTHTPSPPPLLSSLGKPQLMLGSTVAERGKQRSLV
jgi:hypothetical protein